jgi:uncharacterized protein YaiI (UPF0178 family)
MRVLVDGDSSGHRDFLVALAKEMDGEMVWVCNHASRPPWVEPGSKLSVRHMDIASQAADMELMNLSRPGDIVVTGDLGLASVCVSRGAAALSPRGFWYRVEDMAQRLEWRALGARLRRGGVNLDKKPAATRLDDHRFEEELRHALKDGHAPEVGDGLSS